MTEQAARIIGHNLRGDRQKDDFYATPAATTRALLKKEGFFGRIWEPCCGEGHMSEVLIDEGYTVESSDLVDRGYGTSKVDFLMETEVRANIITNPPYKDAEAYVRQAIRLSEFKCALLLRLNFLEGIKRRSLFESDPPVRVYVFSRRQAFMKNGEDYSGRGGMMALAWFVWDNRFPPDYTNEPVLGWI